MTLDELLKFDNIPEDQKLSLSHEDIVKFFWKYKGLVKKEERNNAFWHSTNENLKFSYEKLAIQEKALEDAYGIIQEDLRIAGQIQTSLLPNLKYKIDNDVDIAIYNKQLEEVGGDYYDLYMTKSNEYAIGLFDISGHGVSAALIMSYLKAQFMQITRKSNSPRDVVKYVNNVSLNFFKKVKRYATVNFVLFETNKIKYVCGGGYGLLIHGNKISYFNNNDNFIGLRKSQFHEFELPFDNNDIIALYTDGIIESQNENGNDYTAKRLNETIINNAKKEVNEILKGCIIEYNKFVKRNYDDITLIILKKRRF